ncbi:ArsR family transcriptional regulator [Terrimicrobium sacchariphilum]|jgi:ArsR family transcriptional regulator|uniref:ArsR family transcriptional regulator n=1 Tax=Terrimicrobium sacchariphilum TaxID=690879 RepID=A0A146GDE1_TERSA|nr:metalloregulator ArsR/SmtB family transcription factor [Terrimicrobium sacchariphilum]GAT35579.1 ArsR family transcriptional regulator [Terrimicrobium sacchariphilum]
MDLIQIYQCLCDRTRLRIVNLLTHGPLCVCHFQQILDIPQAKVSQHLAYLRKHEMVETTRKGTWIIYSLPERPTRELEANLKCLQDCTASDKMFHEDLTRLSRIQKCSDWKEYCGPKSCC